MANGVSQYEAEVTTHFREKINSQIIFCEKAEEMPIWIIMSSIILTCI
jgi:hypothetical protein